MVASAGEMRRLLFFVSASTLDTMPYWLVSQIAA